MKLGLIGSDIAQSLSPEIHQTALRECGIEGSYSLFPTQPNELQSRLADCYEKGFTGLNITAPYKAAVLPFLAGKSELVNIIGSANTLVRTPTGWFGESTDGFGIRYALQLWKEFIQPDHGLILGNGGFARAVAYELLTTGWKVTVCERTQKNVDWHRLKSCLEANISHIEWKDLKTITPKVNLLVNTTQIESHVLSTSLDAYMCLPSQKFFVDCGYYLRITHAMSTFIKNGYFAQNGIRILLGQAAASFQIWTNTLFPDTILSNWQDL